MYVTLEPCCHVGRTGPCTQRILDAGVTRVVVATLDPFPRVAGRGVEVLRAAGVAVEVGLEGAAARRLNAGFLSAHERRRPFVIVKAAVSADGRIAAVPGAPSAISGPAAAAPHAAAAGGGGRDRGGERHGARRRSAAVGPRRRPPPAMAPRDLRSAAADAARLQPCSPRLATGR